MQRLFSTFPNGRPGCGLLLLRLTCGAALWISTATQLGGWPFDAIAWMRLIACLAAVLVLAGLWTPLAASCLAMLLVALAVTGDTSASTPIIVAPIAASLVLLGPGAWSIDARLYGRKRIDLAPRERTGA